MAMVSPIVRKPRLDRVARLTVGTVAFLIVAVPVVSLYAFWNHKHRMLVDWDIKGPTCPIAVHTWREIALHRQPHSFKYGGASFSHLFGGADCASVPHATAFSRQADYVCQFTEPVMVSVVTADGRQVLFEPGFRKRATVALRGGRLSCVIGGWLVD